MVILEEENTNPEKIEILTVNRDTICSYISETYLASVKSWGRRNGKIIAIVDDLQPAAQITCPKYKKITSVEFASFGDSEGVCGEYLHGKCNAPNSKQVVEQVIFLTAKTLLLSLASNK